MALLRNTATWSPVARDAPANVRGAVRLAVRENCSRSPLGGVAEVVEVAEHGAVYGLL